MNARIDFSLSGRFDIVEQMIFRLVLADVTDVSTIRELLSVYSDEVIANSIKKLVNYQILRANLDSRVLSISEPVIAIIEECLEQSQHLKLPEDIELVVSDGKAFITDETAKQHILTALLPGLNTGFLTKSIDFVISERGLQYDRG